MNLSSHQPNPPHYTAQQAALYGQLGIKGTTYEISFHAVADLLGNINGKRFLDFGCGTGRSSAFLLAYGAAGVVGVDHNPHMIAAARSSGVEGAHFTQIKQRIPVETECLDGAISTNVFIEIRDILSMMEVCHEINRVLKTGSPFIISTTNPAAFGCSFRNFEYATPEKRQSGAVTTCRIFNGDAWVSVEDTFWKEQDYVTVLESTRFRVTHVQYPEPADPQQWDTDEAAVPPFLILRAIKII